MDKKIIMSLETIMGDRFGKYSKYIIQDRALPDVRDGLKPVQRRILYSMYKEGNLYSKPYRKSAKTVGNVIGNYHPHGTLACGIYRDVADSGDYFHLLFLHGF